MTGESAMSYSDICPECGSLLPVDSVQGLCPGCLIRGALSTDQEGTGVSTALGARKTPEPPSTVPEESDTPVNPGASTQTDAFGSVPRLRIREAETGTPAPPPQPFSSEKPDQLVFGEHNRYRIVGEIACGGMGAVFKGRDSHLGRDVAVKVLRKKHRGDPELLRRIVDEAQIGGQFQHPGIVPVYEVGTLDGDRPYIALKLVRGQTLADMLNNRPSPDVDLPRFLAIFESVCQTMAYAHARAVIHRDLKPANIMVGAFAEVQVMDWGLAKVLHPASGSTFEPRARNDAEPIISCSHTGSSTVNSRAGAVVGTFAYMAPEQARGESHRLVESADVFGLGSILCEILTDYPAYTGPSSPEIRRKATNGETEEALSRLSRCGADAGLVDLAASCLSVDPDGRPKDAGEVAERLSSYLAGVQERLKTAEMDRVKAEALVVEERRRRRLLMALTASLLLVAIIPTVMAGWLSSANEKVVNSLDIAFDVIRFCDDFSDDPRLQSAGLERFRKELRLKARDFFGKLSLQSGGGARLEAARGKADVSLAKICRLLNDFPEAIASCDRGLEIFQRLARAYPDDLSYLEGQARAYHEAAMTRWQNHESDLSSRDFDRANDIWESLAHKRRDYRYQQVVSLNQSGRMLCSAKLWLPRGKEILQRSLELSRDLVQEDRARPEYRNELANALAALGNAQAWSGEFPSGRTNLQEAIHHWRELVGQNPDEPSYRHQLAWATWGLVVALNNNGFPRDARDVVEPIEPLVEPLVRQHPDVPLYAEDCALLDGSFASSLAMLGCHTEAKARTERAVSRAPGSPRMAWLAACNYAEASDRVGDQGLTPSERHVLVDSYRARAMDMLRRARDLGRFKEPAYVKLLGCSEFNPLRGREDFQQFVRELGGIGPDPPVPARSSGNGGGEIAQREILDPRD
jgi:serine/threonine protein kinase